MAQKPPALIEDMQTLYYADVRPYKEQLKKKMPKVPDYLVLIYWPTDKSYCILGTDAAFEHWDEYTNYAFKEVEPALEFADTILHLPDSFSWIKV
ncbi:MAG TPA: hypothetical protein VGN63_02160 [Flavisolibacter sp.]|jgi:hypothetical protein|nr:hypothetical protein [Flavisolibacter sp.]